MRAYVSRETQEMHQRLKRKRRQEENRMKMLFRNAMENDCTSQLQNERLAYENELINAHNRQRRRNLLNKKTSRASSSSRKGRGTSTARGMNFRYHPTVPQKQRPIRPTSPGKTSRTSRSRSAQEKRKQHQSVSSSDNNPVTRPPNSMGVDYTVGRPMCKTCQFLRLDICVHDP